MMNEAAAVGGQPISLSGGNGTSSHRTLQRSTQMATYPASWKFIDSAHAAEMRGILDRLVERRSSTRLEIGQRQSRSLVQLLGHAYRTVPFYRERLEEIRRLSVRTPLNELWPQVPLLTRRDVQQAGESLQSTCVPKEHSGRHTLSTGGSTGAPVTILATDRTHLAWQAFALDEHLRHGRDMQGKLAAIRYRADRAAQPPHGKISPNWGHSTADVLKTGPGAVLSIQSTTEQQAIWLRRVAPDYLLTYPSCLEAIAQHFLAAGWRLPSLRQARCFGEVVEPSVREACGRAWGVPVTDVYSSQEVGYIASQCAEHDDTRQPNYHVEEGNVYVEVLDEHGEPCRPGDAGRVVVTALHNWAMPLVRYEIGDLAEVGEPCPCGSSQFTLRRILGRQRNMLVLPSGDRLWPALQLDQLPGGDRGELPPIGQMQVVQRSVQRLDVRYVAPRALHALEQAVIKTWIQSSVPSEFNVTFQQVEQIDRTPSGKFEDFRCEVTGPPICLTSETAVSD